MEQDSSFNNQLRREITVRAVMNKKIKMLKSDIDENIKKIYDVDKEIKRVKKLIYKRKQKNRNYIDLSLRLIKLKNSKTDLKNEINALNQIISHVEDVKEEVKLKIKQLKNKIKNNPKENPFDFTDIVGKQKRRKRNRSWSISRNSRRKQNYIQSSTSNHSHRRYGKITKWLFYQWIFHTW